MVTFVLRNINVTLESPRIDQHETLTLMTSDNILDQVECIYQGLLRSFHDLLIKYLRRDPHINGLVPNRSKMLGVYVVK